MATTIHAAAQEIRAGRLTPVDLLEQCLARIDHWEDRVHAWVFVDREAARAAARRLGEELKAGKDRGPLQGIPVGVKDVFDVAGWPTVAGCARLAKNVAKSDAPVVHRLREAGAILMGKTVTTQFASFDPPPTRNPWNLARTPGGSSSGSAVAVACGMCLGALGTQTGGSLARPAAYCGVASFKPSYGRLPVDGVIPLAWSLDHVGVIAGCVIDVGLLLGALCVPALASLGDPISALQKRRKTRLVREMTGRDRDPENPRSAEDREVLLNLLERSLATTFGRVRDLFDWEAGREVTSLMDRVCAFLAERGGVVEVRLPETFVDVLANHRTVMAVEAAAYHQKDYERAPQTYGPAIAGLIEEGLACPATHYARCREHQRQLTAAMKPVFNQVPVLVAPATTGPAPDAATTGDPAFNSPWSYLGLPTISLRAGQALDGMPLGIQVVGPPRGESVVYHYAALIEEVLALEPLTPPG